MDDVLEIQWRLNQIPLTADHRITFDTDEQGKYSMTIRDVCTEDNGQYSCTVITPEMSETKSCLLMVQGESLL
jgi:hypothetical protein